MSSKSITQGPRSNMNQQGGVFFVRCSPGPALPCSVCNNSKIFSLVSAKNSLEHHQWIISGVSADREAMLGS